MAKAKQNNLLAYEEFHTTLEAFSEKVTSKFSVFVKGEPEDQLKPPVDTLFTEFGKLIQRKLVLKGESTLEDRLGKPDYALSDELLPIGYIELKAPGKGANPLRYKGHDKKQWNRFKKVPNILYTDGNEWAVYQSGERVSKLIRLNGDVCNDGKKAVSKNNSKELFHLLVDFIQWAPIVPKKPKQLAAYLAPFCLLIREEVQDALKDENSPVQSLKNEIKDLLFPDADDFQFSDAYAQTVIFALLLAQMEGADVLDLNNAYSTLESHHLLLARSLHFLTDPKALTEISSSLSLAQRVIHEIPKETLQADSDTDDPWLFFYEDFLAAYDPKLRKESGVYFTPLEVVRCQVHLIDEILSQHLGKEMGFVEPGVATLDPAVGTGTYLLAIIDHALRRVSEDEGHGAIKGAAQSLIKNLHGFELMVGAYSVAQLRVTRALTSHGVSIPESGPGIYLTNTLESPHTKPPVPPLFHEPIAHEHKRALEIKDKESVLVCLGNPPYGRHEAVTKENHALTGGWVRHKDENNLRPILEDFLEPARQAGFGVHLKNMYNHYVYFIRWSLWKVFEHKTAKGPGILSFITASSYLDGDAFVGVREHMRRICDHIDIIDLGGEGRGTRKDENIFSIRTPVAIFIGYRKQKSDPDIPATVRYARIEGTRDEKLQQLDKIQSAKGVDWEKVPSDWQEPFIPQTVGRTTKWPLLTDIFPWQNNGVQCKRTWVIGPTQELLNERWTALLSSKNKREAMKESGDRTIDLEKYDLFESSIKLPAISTLPKNESPQNIIEYSYHSFDRQYLLADNRLISRPRPPLWLAHSEKQIYLTSLFNHPLGQGPAITVASCLPDLHHFRGSFGAKEVMPLYRNAEATESNLLPGLLDLLKETYGKKVSPEDFAGYVYAVLAQPEYTSRFEKELTSRQVRVPLTKDGKLFFELAEFGQSLIWLHTYAQRMTNKSRKHGKIPKGAAKCKKAVSDKQDDYPEEYSYDESTKTLFVGDGSFGPISKEIYEFEVSGLKVVQSWLGYRMKKRSGKKSSPLDDIRPENWTYQFTHELLELLWVLEKTIEGYSVQIELFDKILESELFLAEELPEVSEEMRKAPIVKKKTKQMELGFEE
ncbi:MAG: N-6 DNA methylase [Planctomycetes bacterium]|nr:N-6 DNA methylase [Planctomycetota bacterium]